MELSRRRLLVLSTYPREDASVRHRFFAYQSDLREAGWDVRFESVVSSRLFRRKNDAGLLATVEKAMRLLTGLARRIVVLVQVGRYDAVWIHREAYPFFTPLGERIVRRLSHGRILLDFDDALYERPPGGRDWRSALRRPSSFARAARCADVVLAGSPVLVEWARQNGIHAYLAPTSVAVAPRPAQRTSDEGPVTIGWIGSWSTAAGLADISESLRYIAARGKTRLLLVGAPNLRWLAEELPGAEWRRWEETREDADLAEFDIGIMPVSDTPWNRGKCAFKLIQYMAHATAFVASPVGMNIDVASASGGGFLADSQAEWAAALERLIDDSDLRRELGRAGHAYALMHFDLRARRNLIISALDEMGPLN